MKKTDEQLARNLAGQLRGIERMMEEKRDCLEILVQLKAVKAGVAGLSRRIIARGMDDCLASGRKDRKKITKLIEESTRD